MRKPKLPRRRNPAVGGIPLPPERREALRRAIAERGEEMVISVTRAGRYSLSRAGAGFTVRRGTCALIEAGLALLEAAAERERAAEESAQVDDLLSRRGMP
jgi:hypothetical protein